MKHFKRRNLYKDVEFIKADGDDYSIIPLTSIDIYESLYVIGFVFFYNKTLDADELKQSLAKTLEKFQVLSGRLRSRPNGDMEVHCNNEGVAFSVSQINSAMKKYNRENPAKREALTFLDVINPMKLKDSTRPLTTVKLTQFSGGGSALGISIAHNLVDGQSYFFFVDYWSRIQRGLGHNAEPCHDRMLLEPEVYGIINGEPDKPDGFRALSTCKLLGSFIRYLYHYIKMDSAVFHFTRVELENMKKSASLLENGSMQRVSTNDALCAHLWKVMSSLKKKGPDVRRRLLMVGNIRSKTELPLPSDYFGNASYHFIIDMDESKLQSDSIHAVAGAIRKEVNTVRNDSIMEQMRWLRYRLRARKLLGVFANYDPYRDDLFISSDAGYPGYGADFGTGCPDWITIQTYPVPWALLFMPDPSKKGGIDVHFNLSKKLIKTLKKDIWQSLIHTYR